MLLTPCQSKITFNVFNHKITTSMLISGLAYRFTNISVTLIYRHFAKYLSSLSVVRTEKISLGLFHLKEYGRGGRLFFRHSLPHFISLDWTPPPSLHIYRLDPTSLLAFLKKSSTPPLCSFKCNSP